jgi:hypothetical protein
MSDSRFYDEALDALYKVAKVSANLIETALTSDFESQDRERLELALKILKITWTDNEDDED